MISLDEAQRLLLADVEPLEQEEVALGDALWRVLAADVIARFDQPAQPMSAMDGYAVRTADATIGARLRLVGEAYAGDPCACEVTPGTAVRIATGGVVPNGAEQIVVQEIVTREGDEIRLDEEPGEEAYVRPAGGDFRAGDVQLTNGQQLTAARIGLAVAASWATVSVRRKPRVAIFPSGDELREPGETLGPGEVVNSAAYAVEGLVRRWGGDARRQDILPDDREHCVRLVEAAKHDADILLFIGGASVGDRDVLRPVVEDLGGRVKFDRIAVQPGKPSWHAQFADGPLVLGLPGNPASAFVCAHLLLEPLVAALLGRASRTQLHGARLLTAMSAGGARETYWRATASLDLTGQLVVAPDPRRDSSLQTPLANANALIKRPASADPSRKGDVVQLILL